jgi:hypothetical protein
MSSNSYKSLRVFFIIFFSSAFVLGLVSYASGQQQQTQQQTTSEKIESVQQEVQGNNVQLDATTATTLAGIGVGGIALIRELMGRSKLKKADAATDKDTGMSLLYHYRLVQTMDAFLPGFSTCLDQPFSSDPMAKHITIRMKLAEDAAEWASYLATTLNVSTPSMTPAPSVTVADSGIQTPVTKEIQQVSQANLTTPKSPPPPPAAAAPNNNTTVGK